MDYSYELSICNSHIETRILADSVSPGLPEEFAPFYLCSLTKKQLRQISLLNFTDLSNLESLPAIYNLPAIQAVKIENCNELCDLSSLKYFPQLRKLELSGLNSLVALKDLKNLKHLNDLTITRCELIVSWEPLADLLELNSFTYADSYTKSLDFLHAIPVHDALTLSDIYLLECLNELPSVKDFFISNCPQLTDISILKNNEYITNLTIINDNSITDISPVGTMANLENLTLDIPYVMDFGFLENLTGLKSLTISNNNIKNFDFLLRCINLESVMVFSGSLENIDAIHAFPPETKFNVDLPEHLFSFYNLPNVERVSPE